MDTPQVPPRENDFLGKDVVPEMYSSVPHSVTSKCGSEDGERGAGFLYALSVYAMCDLHGENVQAVLSFCLKCSATTQTYVVRKTFDGVFVATTCEDEFVVESLVVVGSQCSVPK